MDILINAKDITPTLDKNTKLLKELLSRLEAHYADDTALNKRINKQVKENNELADRLENMS